MNITKFCNIFSETIEAKDMKIRAGLASHNIKGMIDKVKEKQGGLWVGGKFTISMEINDYLQNKPNKIRNG